MKLLRPRLGVGTKTWIGFSVVFWVPVFITFFTLFFLFENVFIKDLRDVSGIYLQSVEDAYFERAHVLKEVMIASVDSSQIQYALESKNKYILQNFLVGFGKKNPHANLLFFTDENFKLITSKNGRSGILLNIGNALPQAILSGQTTVNSELMSAQFIFEEDKELKQQMDDTAGLVQFVIYPVRSRDKIIGAFIAGMLLTGDPWLGNTVYNRFGVEMAVFAGEGIESSHLHVFPTIPRKAWTAGERIPSSIKNEISLGRSYSGEIERGESERVFAAFKPLKDSKDRVIGAIGLSMADPGITMKVFRPILISLLVTAVVGFILAMSVTLLVNYDITSPIRLLQSAMDSFGKGDINTRVDLETGDEFEGLGRGFNEMADGIAGREDRLRKHYEVTKLLMSTLDLKDLLRNILGIVTDITSSEMGIIYLVNKENRSLMPKAHYGVKADLPEMGIEDGYPGIALHEKRHILIQPESGMLRDGIDLGFATGTPAELVYIPLIFNEDVLGILVLGSTGSYTREDIQLFDYLANQISIALDNAMLHAKVREISIIDSLTRLNNRHYLNDRLQGLWSKCQRHNIKLAVILADIDNFKIINDTYGHKKGDEVLEHVANVLLSHARKEDIVVRYGGEEFVIILEGSDSVKAVEFAERIRKTTESVSFPWMEGSVTLSLGVAIYPDVDVNDADKLLQEADKAMYVSKTGGKNRVTIAK